MRRLNTLSRAVAFAGALATLPAVAQMGGGTGGPTDGMTNGTEDLIIPAGVRGAGRFSSFFLTDLWVKACGTGSVTLSFHAADSASSAPTATTTVNITKPVTYLPDVLRASFGLAAGSGAIRVTAGFPVSATVRVYSQTGAGTYGVALMGMPSRMGMTSMPMAGLSGVDEYAMYMLGLLPAPGNRVNVNVVSTSSTDAAGVMEIVDADGSAPTGPGATSLPFTLAGYSSHQFNDVLLNVHSRLPAGDAGLQIRVRLNQGDPGMVVAYAVVTDNTTNDGSVVMGMVMNGGRGMGGGMGTDPGAGMGVPEYGGTGCPDGSVSATLSPDARSLSLLFDKYQVAVGGVTNQSFDRKSCSIAIPVHVPPGSSVSVLQIDFRGFNHLPESATSQFNVEYFFAGTRGPVFQRNFTGLLDEDYLITNELTGQAVAWSGCGAEVILRANSSMEVNTVSNKEAMASIDSQDVKGGVVYKLQWRRCS